MALATPAAILSRLGRPAILAETQGRNGGAPLLATHERSSRTIRRAFSGPGNAVADASMVGARTFAPALAAAAMRRDPSWRAH